MYVASRVVLEEFKQKVRAVEKAYLRFTKSKFTRHMENSSKGYGRVWPTLFSVVVRLQLLSPTKA